ncbi:MAG: hypothetical protein ACE5FZ_01425 [Nitrospiria bacterium]
MRIKKFEAYEVSQALREIKQEMGEEAVILSTREVRKKGAVILRRPLIEVTAAVDLTTTSQKTDIENRPVFEEHLAEAARIQELEGPSVFDALRDIKASIEVIRKEDLSKNENKTTNDEALREIKTSIEKIRNEDLLNLENKTASDEALKEIKASIEKLQKEDLLKQESKLANEEALREIKASIEVIRKEDLLKREDLSGNDEALREIKASLETMQGDIKSEQEQESGKIHETWMEMKVMLKALTDLKQQEEVSVEPSALDKMFNQLVSNGIDEKVTKALFKLMQDKLNGKALWEEEHVRGYLRQIMEGVINVSGPIGPTGELSKAVMLVGPTGVGKTDTLAKIAAEQIRLRRKVTMVTLDSNRVGGIEKLMSYAKKVGAPVMVVGSGNELKHVVSERRKGELILIDTPGRSHRNLRELSSLKALSAIGVPLETHLVLSSNTRETDMSDMIDRFSVIPINSLLFTKMDETRTYGSLFTVMGRKKKPVSYFTSGQRVPEDIEAATSSRLAELVLC